MRVHARTFFLASIVALGVKSGSAQSFPIEETTIAEVHTAYIGQKTTAVEVVQAHLDRIAAYDRQGPILNSVITVNPNARAEAAALDAKLKATGHLVGPLHGIPVLIKDNLDAVGMPMTSGFQGWKNYVPPTDAMVVKKIRDAGGIILAKVSLSEFARGGGDNINSVLPGFARNPYNPAHATGGSSGGTGAGLAANFGIVGIGTDTGGSVRMPAAHNALAGLRPTVGLVSRTGVVPLNGVRDTAGPMARTVADMAILLDVIAGSDPEDSATLRSERRISPGYRAALRKDSLKGARLGVLRQVFTSKVTDPRIIAHFEKTLVELKAAGAEIVDPFTIPELDLLPRPPQTPARFKADLTSWLAKHPGIPFSSVKEIAESRLLHPLHQAGFDDAVKALPPEEDPATLEGARNEQRYRDAFTTAMTAQAIDAVVFPTWAQLPALNGDRNTQLAREPKPPPHAAPTALGSSLTFVGSSLQWPALSVPSGFIDGLPVGLQVLGRAWDEERIVNYAYAYEQATRHRRPPSTTPPLQAAFAHRFIGTWKLVEVAERDEANQKVSRAARGPSSGQLVYTASGRLSVQIMTLDRSRVAPGSAEGFSSYFGRWELLPSEACVLHIQEGNVNAAQVGQTAKRYYSFDQAGKLSLATPPRKRDDGRVLSSIFIWERLE